MSDATKHRIRLVFLMSVALALSGIELPSTSEAMNEAEETRRSSTYAEHAFVADNHPTVRFGPSPYGH
jgi:hypothetical protein